MTKIQIALEIREAIAKHREGQPVAVVVSRPSADARAIVGRVLAASLHEQRVMTTPGVREAFDEALTEINTLRAA